MAREMECTRCGGERHLDAYAPDGPTVERWEVCGHCGGTGEEPARECDCCDQTAVTYREDLSLHLCALCARECEAEDARDGTDNLEGVRW